MRKETKYFNDNDEECNIDNDDCTKIVVHTFDNNDNMINRETFLRDEN